MFRQNLQAFARAAKWPVMDYGLPHFSLTPAIIQQLRELPYLERWKTSIANQWYHVRLEDHSLLTFSSTATSASYAYLHCPLDAPTFRQFALDMGHQFNAAARAELLEEYQLIIDTAMQKANVTPIRYDYDENGYRRGVHPVSHIHIGLDNHVRLSSSKRLTPTSFALFVMRQMYPECWARVLDHQEAARLPKAIRLGCVPLHEPHWHEQDQVELHFV
ncbi:DUF2290 domain-containing protein [Acidovorax sp. DW039]|uniref:DUF2290 domain-containing protein n=1 Tax=Acidovorax sp. DW039 TaxID=3095606 RepID=UPI0030D4E8C5